MVIKIIYDNGGDVGNDDNNDVVGDDKCYTRSYGQT